ncbi:hypothetical protein ACFY2T_33265 [Streptomyces sp. NPDC001260]|uniref:hypothetical protein n=1 Tax=Streptomyces sp. NPDC001260 TaxID=3364551 RepID=UPI0036BE1520
MVAMIGTRQSIAIRNPDRSLNWEKFPRFALRRRTIYRAAKRGKGAWYFCANGDCRFDLSSPRGTCYVGTDELSGILESLGPDWCAGEQAIVLISDLINERQVHSYKPPTTWHLANLCHRKAGGFRISNELSDMTPYDVPHEYAKLFDAIKDKTNRHRFHGIRFKSRFDTDLYPRAVALFGDEGEATWISAEVQDIGDDLIAQLAEVGIWVDEPPAKDELDRVRDDSEAA